MLARSAQGVPLWVWLVLGIIPVAGLLQARPRTTSLLSPVLADVSPVGSRNPVESRPDPATVSAS